MVRKTLISLTFCAAVALNLGCAEDTSTPKTNNAPISTKEGADKKGHKTKTIEATFEDPPKK